MKIKYLLLIIFFAAAPLCAKEETVVLVHGFMSGAWQMGFLKKNLKKQRWEVVSWNYPSRDHTIECHGKRLAEQLRLLAEQHPGRPIHFVAHSMGSLVILAALNEPDCPEEAKRGRVALIAPPLKGAAWARWLARFPLARSVLREFSGRQLMQKNHFEDLGQYPDSLEKILVVAGNFGFNPFIDGENDGTVGVAETELTVPHERKVIRRGHKTIVFSKKVCYLIQQFLEPLSP